MERPVVRWTCVVVTACARWEWRAPPGTATPCCCFIHPPRSSGPKPVKTCMHAFISVRVLRKRRGFINRSKTNLPQPPLRIKKSLQIQTNGTATSYCWPFQSLLSSNSDIYGSGSFPQMLQLLQKTRSIKIPRQLWWWCRCILTAVCPSIKCLMFKYAALLKEKRISILGRLYFIVFMWESGLARVYLHQSTVPLINKPLPYQNFQSTLPMGNTLFASPVFSEKVNQAKIGCNYFFILFFFWEWLLAVCACAVWMCLSTCSLLSSAPLLRKTTFCAFFFSLLQLYKHIVKEQMSFFFFFGRARLGRRRRQ